MDDVPPEMMANGRPADKVFHDEERLYRRFEPDNLDGDEISIATVELPDMSVAREKYGRPEWLLLQEEYQHWGVLAFRVRDMPTNREVWHEGVIAYVLFPAHVPFKLNFPHSEVRVTRDGTRICKESGNLNLLDPDFHLRWRECIVLASQIIVPPRPL